jgi:inhibitor of nuclear factor kappa-B kinase subunit alpha
VGNCVSKIIKAMKLPRSTVYNVLKRYKETGSASDRPRSGRPRTARTPQLIKSVREKLRRNPDRNIAQLAREAHVGQATMHQIVTKDLGKHSYKKVRRQLLSEATKLKRLQRAKQLLSAGTRCPIIWTDEKIFTVERFHNRQNDRILAKNIEDIPHNIRVVGKRQKPASCMVWAGVRLAMDRRPPLLFIEEGVKVNFRDYLDLLESQVAPWITNAFGNKDFVFQQDGAPAHTSNLVQKLAKENFKGFWAKEIWPRLHLS